MTSPTPPAEARVEQRHRDAAADWIYSGSYASHEHAAAMRDGELDNHRLVQAFAAFERDLLASHPAAPVPQWRCINCKHLVTGHLKPDRCPSCNWCQGFTEVALSPAPSAPVGEHVDVARYFFEIGYAACWADGYIANGEKAVFPLTDAVIDRAWEIAPEATDDPVEFDRYLALAALSPAPSADEIGWVVGGGDGKRYRCWSSAGPDWTDDLQKATRYARREDAEAVHAEDEDAWRVVPFATEIRKLKGQGA